MPTAHSTSVKCLAFRERALAPQYPASRDVFQIASHFGNRLTLRPSPLLVCQPLLDVAAKVLDAVIMSSARDIVDSGDETFLAITEYSECFGYPWMCMLQPFKNQDHIFVDSPVVTPRARGLVPSSASSPTATVSQGHPD